ncbi:MAG: hypothetical protein R3E95_10070 [Thiolinea sp.]
MNRLHGPGFLHLSWRWLVMLCSALLLHACQEAPAPDDYFPLQDGLSWTYQVNIDLLNRQQTSRFRIENIGTVTIDDTLLHVRRTSDQTDYYILKTDHALYRWGKRTAVEYQPRRDDPQRQIMPLPPSTDSRLWTSLTHPYTFRQTLPTEESLTEKIQLEMAYNVVDMEAEITVPAGTFQHCLLIRGEGEFSMYVDPKDGYQTIEVTTREWYAPGVGLVKLERNEPIDTHAFKGGRIVMELVEKDF